MFHSLRVSNDDSEDIHHLAILFFVLFILTFVSVLAYSESISDRADDMVREEFIAGVFYPPSSAESRSDLCYLGGSEPR